MFRMQIDETASKINEIQNSTHTNFYIRQKNKLFGICVLLCPNTSFGSAEAQRYMEIFTTKKDVNMTRCFYDKGLEISCAIGC